MASCTNKFAIKKFLSIRHSKEGYTINECIEGRHRHVLEFLIPILYARKSTQVTVIVANTIFGAMEESMEG